MVYHPRHLDFIQENRKWVTKVEESVHNFEFMKKNCSSLNVHLLLEDFQVYLRGHWILDEIWPGSVQLLLCLFTCSQTFFAKLDRNYSAKDILEPNRSLATLHTFNEHEIWNVPLIVKLQWVLKNHCSCILLGFLHLKHSFFHYE